MSTPTVRLIKQLDFIREIDKLKYILRQTCLFESERRENDAEHTWHLVMMAVILQEYTNEPIDLLKVLKMLLIHDLVEIDAGDTFAFDVIVEDVFDKEKKAAERIFGLLPEDQKDELIMLWHEFEKAESAEAKFAKAIDRLEPVLQNISNKGGTWHQHQIPVDRVINKINPIEQGSNSLWDYIEPLVTSLAKEGLIPHK